MAMVANTAMHSLKKGQSVVPPGDDLARGEAYGGPHRQGLRGESAVGDDESHDEHRLNDLNSQHEYPS